MEIFNSYEKRIIEILLTGDKTLPELSMTLGISKPGTSKYLKKLEERRILRGTYEKNVDGRTIRYQLQPFQMVFSINPSLKTVLSFKADDTLDQEFFLLGSIPQKEFRNEVKEHLEKLITTSIPRYTVILFGSVAQGTASRKSDIDVLLVKESWVKAEKNSILGLFAGAAVNTAYQIKPLFLGYADFKRMDLTLKKEIKDHGIIIFEKGSPWEVIHQELRRYKSITI
ncbi:MAG: nucleotidyltransferase domain-containing protein [Euryarchaeota archaeon]|nr:nucleotidyltransferase domain-containing protein [Euryarchaeota archaeon]